MHQHAHEHDHDGHDGHDHAGHSHGVSRDADFRRLIAAFALIAGFMVVEIVVGIIANSLALITDALHMLTDALALLLAAIAVRLAARPPRGDYTFGWQRSEILSAQINGATLIGLGVYVVIDAVGRLIDPPTIDGGMVLIVGTIGAMVNIGAAAMIASANRQSLNVAGARAHVMMDLLGSVGAMAAGAIVLLVGWDLADPLIALLIAGLMFRSGWHFICESGRVLLEAAPRGIDPEAVGQVLAATPGVEEIHDLHIWEVTTHFPALSAHVLVADGADCHGIRGRLQAIAAERFGIEHVTLQVEHVVEADDALLTIGGTAS